jgi:hypothetical protein
VIVGGAIAGFVVYATSPATGIAVDAATFLLAAALTTAMRVPKSLHMGSSNFLADLALGWREFTGRAPQYVRANYLSSPEADTSGTSP